ncbi:hypothetical protein AbraIFM66950_003410 [Aspergillus brasiliensis]|nr:hypothetical protein AbraIFM66950_003410 [Aspergillus brasiliensis]
MKIVLLGSTGQIGQSILRALLTKSTHHVLQLISPQSESTAASINKQFTAEQQSRLTTQSVDLLSCTADDLVPYLANVEIIISALNGKALQAQSKVQDAGAKAGVRRFYPSEYGMHHVYRPGGDEVGYLHPMWNTKSTANEACLHHPAVKSGSMTYTLIGCGDFYNQSREKIWCPWTNPKASEYTLYILGDADASIDFTHIDDLGEFVVETINYLERSENRTLNFVSDRISYNQIAKLLERYSGKKVKKIVYPMSLMDEVWKDKNKVPAEVKGQGAFPDDFWILVKGMQGAGRFWRPPGEVHNREFGVEGRTFDWYLKGLFGGEYVV